MPITPSEAREKERGRWNPDIARWISKIDEGLGDGGRKFSTRLQSPLVVDEIIRVYQHVGWKVERVSDQRDGDYLEFTP
jgi:hypothetical protein